MAYRHDSWCVHSRIFLLATAVALSLLQSSRSSGQVTEPDDLRNDMTSPAAESFVRLRRDAEGKPVALQTATARYVSSQRKGELFVDLVGVVHIGDRTYYDQFNELFKQYDVLLYELVAAEGTTIPEGGRPQSGNPITMIHGIAQSMLGLESQMDHVDYTAENFVHADMSPAEMADAMKKRGDNGLTFALNAAADMIRQANIQAKEMEAKVAAGEVPPLEEVDLFTMLTDAGAGGKLKLQLAEQFGAMGSPDMALGATINQSLIQDRNAAAMRVFQRELAAGHRKIGIFYGAAHMPDFERRLQQEFGLRREKTDWATAWDLTLPTPKTDSPLRLMLRLLDQ